MLPLLRLHGLYGVLEALMDEAIFARGEELEKEIGHFFLQK